MEKELEKLKAKIMSEGLPEIDEEIDDDMVEQAYLNIQKLIELYIKCYTLIVNKISKDSELFSEWNKHYKRFKIIDWNFNNTYSEYKEKKRINAYVNENEEMINKLIMLVKEAYEE